MVTISEINRLDDLAEIRDLWRELWWRTPGASFFQSVEWFEKSRQCLEGSKRLRVLVVSVSGRPVGIVPLEVRRVWTPVGPMRVLGYPSDEFGFRRGPLGTNPSLMLDAALKHVATTPRHWDWIELTHVHDGRDRGRTPRILRHHGFARRGSDDCRAVVSCQDDWMHYWESRSNDLRVEVRQCEQQLADQGLVEYVRYRPEGNALDDDDPRWDLFNELEIERFENGTGSQDGRERPDAKETLRRFLREMHQTAVQIAGIDFNVLRLNGRPVAWAYNYRCDGRIEMQIFDAASEWEPMASTVLLARMLRDGFRRADESYVFDVQTSRRAAAWQTGDATSRRYTRVSPVALRAQAVRVGGWLRSQVTRGETPRPLPGDRRSVPRIAG